MGFEAVSRRTSFPDNQADAFTLEGKNAIAAIRKLNQQVRIDQVGAAPGALLDAHGAVAGHLGLPAAEGEAHGEQVRHEGLGVHHEGADR